MGSDKSVLIVEDVSALRRLVVRQLADLGFRTFEASDAVEALKILETETVDLLFTDVIFSKGETGFSLARKAKARSPGLRLLFTSGFSDTTLKAEAGFINAKILAKPFRRASLAEALREVMDAPA